MARAARSDSKPTPAIRPASPLAKAKREANKKLAEQRAMQFCGVLSRAKMWHPYREWQFHPVRLWRFDFAWPDHKLALEVDGGIWVRGAHGRGTGIQRDQEKLNAAAVLGWRVLRVQPKELATMATVHLVREALAVQWTDVSPNTTGGR